MSSNLLEERANDATASCLASIFSLFARGLSIHCFSMRRPIEVLHLSIAPKSEPSFSPASV